MFSDMTLVGIFNNTMNVLENLGRCKSDNILLDI